MTIITVMGTYGQERKEWSGTAIVSSVGSEGEGFVRCRLLILLASYGVRGIECSVVGVGGWISLRLGVMCL